MRSKNSLVILFDFIPREDGFKEGNGWGQARRLLIYYKLFWDNLLLKNHHNPQ